VVISTVSSCSARELFAGGVAHLDPASAVFEAMLDGWARQQRVRFLKAHTITSRLKLVRRLRESCGRYPWQWRAVDVESFVDQLRAGEAGVVYSTARTYLNDVRLFLEYVTDARYEWPAMCVARFGQAPQMVLHEWNTIAHTAEFEGQPGRRPLTYDEVQALLDAADERVVQARNRGRMGVLSATRDAALLKTYYAFGLRRAEGVGLDLVDLRRNPKVAHYGRFGGLFVRCGKSSRGGPPKRRTVLTVPQMDWAVDVLGEYVDEIRPRFDPGQHPALWVTERRGRLSKRAVNDAFRAARQVAGLPEELDLHSLRHSYVTHLIEFDYPERFVSEQVGHSYASTTAIYTGVGDEYRNRLLRRALSEHDGLWEEGE
jgi:site-specific recombinase XerD